MLDAFLYIYLAFLIISNFSLFRSTLNYFINIIILYFSFAVGVGNFGTSIRHRSKFVVMFILLAAHGLHKIKLFKKIQGKL